MVIRNQAPHGATIIQWQPCCGSLGRDSLRDVTKLLIFLVKRQVKTTRGEEANDLAPPPSSLSPGGVRIAALLLGAIEAPHEASSQLARASEVT